MAMNRNLSVRILVARLLGLFLPFFSAMPVKAQPNAASFNLAKFTEEIEAKQKAYPTCVIKLLKYANAKYEPLAWYLVARDLEKCHYISFRKLNLAEVVAAQLSLPKPLSYDLCIAMPKDSKS